MGFYLGKLSPKAVDAYLNTPFAVFGSPLSHFLLYGRDFYAADDAPARPARRDGKWTFGSGYPDDTQTDGFAVAG